MRLVKTVPAEDIEHEVASVEINLLSTPDILARVMIGKRTNGNTGNFRPTQEIINLPELLTAEIAAGNLTAAHVVGLKKCVKAICAKALSMNFTEIDEPLP